MAIIASYNIKGGVGKTAAAVNLAYLAAAEGASTLIWDLDPQGAASYYFRVRPKVKGGGRKVLQGAVGDRIKGTDFPDLDLLPADFSYRNMDLLLDSGKKPERGLKRLLKPLGKEYDYIFLDCPPSISLLSENVFQTADALLVPLIPTTLSLRTLEQLNKFLAQQDINALQLLPFLSMIDRRKKLHKELEQTLPLQFPQLLPVAIPYASEIERMGVERAPLPAYAPNSGSTAAFRRLWQVLQQNLAH